MDDDQQPHAEVTQVPPQAQFDQDIIAHNLGQARAAYAGAKLGCTAARAGIPTGDGATYEQQLQNLESARKVLEFAEQMLLDTDGGEIPEPLAKQLSIVGRMPHPSHQGPWEDA